MGHDSYRYKQMNRQQDITTPFIMITAHDEPGLRDAATRYGAAHYLTKPLRGTTLLQAASAVVKDGAPSLAQRRCSRCSVYIAGRSTSRLWQMLTRARSGLMAHRGHACGTFARLWRWCSGVMMASGREWSLRVIPINFRVPDWSMPGTSTCKCRQVRDIAWTAPTSCLAGRGARFTAAFLFSD